MSKEKCGKFYDELLEVIEDKLKILESKLEKIENSLIQEKKLSGDSEE